MAKKETFDFQLPSVDHERLCLSSLLRLTKRCLHFNITFPASIETKGCLNASTAMHRIISVKSLRIDRRSTVEQADKTKIYTSQNAGLPQVNERSHSEERKSGMNSLRNSYV